MKTNRSGMFSSPARRLPARICPLTQTSASVAVVRRFSGKCCFQVIYFNSNISFSPTRQTNPKARVETIWLTHAVKNARASRLLDRFE
jgi:hypothetical protein